jgi:hypothetical protein
MSHFFFSSFSCSFPILPHFCHVKISISLFCKYEIWNMWCLTKLYEHSLIRALWTFIKRDRQNLTWGTFMEGCMIWDSFKSHCTNLIWYSYCKMQHCIQTIQSWSDELDLKCLLFTIFNIRHLIRNGRPRFKIAWNRVIKSDII